MSIGIVLMVVFFAMLFMNIPITVCLGLSTLATMVIFDLRLTMYIDIIFSGLSKYTLLAVPFFVLSGVVMDKSGISRRMIEFFKLLIGPIPGGPGRSFRFASRSSGERSRVPDPQTVAALGTILIPAMADHGYNKAFAAALIAAVSATAVIIPPSINLVVYGVLAEQSIGTLFIAGIMPGLLVGVCCIVYTYFYSVRHGYKGEAYGSLREILRASKNAIWGFDQPDYHPWGNLWRDLYTHRGGRGFGRLQPRHRPFRFTRTSNLSTCGPSSLNRGVTSASILIIMANASAFTLAPHHTRLSRRSSAPQFSRYPRSRWWCFF